MSKKLISFVIPCYGSEKYITEVINEIKMIVKQKNEYDYEVIAVNDQSPDNVLKVLKGIAKKDEKVKVLNLAKNMNRPGAVMAGLSQTNGDYIIIMDDDGQCPMENLWKLIKPLEDGHDVSMAKYTEYKQSIFKHFGTIINREMTKVIIDKPKNISFTNFMALQRFIVDEILKYKNPYPYLTGLLLRTTNDFVNIEMKERKRIFGGTTFTFKKMLSLWINGFTAFSVKPLRIATYLGCITSLFGFVCGLILIFRKIISPERLLMGYSSLMSVLLFIGGIIMIILGLIGEYVGRIYICLNNPPQYVIKEKVNFKDGNSEKDK